MCLLFCTEKTQGGKKSFCDSHRKPIIFLKTIIRGDFQMKKICAAILTMALICIVRIPSMAAQAAAMTLASEDSIEAADIFATSMKNNFDVGRIIIDRILDGQI